MRYQDSSIAPMARRLAHPDAHSIYQSVLQCPQGDTVVVDLGGVEDVTTSAFAQLVLLRRELLRRGGDLRLRGLHDRAAHLYKINRLDSVLPCC